MILTLKPKSTEMAHGTHSRSRIANDSLSPKAVEMPPTSKQRTNSKERTMGPKSVMKSQRQKMKK